MLCSAALASAEPQIGSRLGERLDKFNSRTDSNAILSAHDLATCTYSHRGSLVRSFLDSRDPAASEAIMLRLGREVECINLNRMAPFAEGQRVHQSRDLYRGMLAEAGVSSMNLKNLAPMPIEQGYPRDWFAVTGRDPAVDEMAVCVAEIDPAGVVALVRTTPQTPDELAAIRTLSTAMGNCLRAGATLSSNRQSTRAALSEALYHRAITPVMAAVAK